MLAIYKRLLRLSRPHIWKFILAMLCMLVVGSTTAAAAYLVKPALDEIFVNKNADALIWIPIAVLLLYLFKGLSSYGQTILMSFIGHRIVADLRYNLYRHIQIQPLSFFTRNPTGTIMSRITYDVNLVRDTVSEAIQASSKIHSRSSRSSLSFFTETGSWPSSPWLSSPSPSTPLLDSAARCGKSPGPAR